MENLADLERKYEELGKEIERLKKQQNGGRAKGERYCYIYSDGDTDCSIDDFGNTDSSRFKLGNYFKTEEEAEKVVEKIQIYVELKRLAERLNNGREIDWNNCVLNKHCICYDNDTNTLDYGIDDTDNFGVIYCLDKDFLSIAIKEIGEDRLKKLFE